MLHSDYTKFGIIIYYMNAMEYSKQVTFYDSNYIFAELPDYRSYSGNQCPPTIH